MYSEGSREAMDLRYAGGPQNNCKFSLTLPRSTSRYLALRSSSKSQAMRSKTPPYVSLPNLWTQSISSICQAGNSVRMRRHWKGSGDGVASSAPPPASRRDCSRFGSGIAPAGSSASLSRSEDSPGGRRKRRPAPKSSTAQSEAR